MEEATAAASFKMPSNVREVQSDDQLKALKHRVDQVSLEAHKLEQKIHDIEQFYSTIRKDKGRHCTNRQKKLDCIAASKRMQDLISQFSTIVNQVTQRRGVDMNCLDSRDSSESIIGNPRDFKSIKKRMEAKDDSGYKHVRDIYADVRWVLKNAMKNNDERSDAHVTANTLLAKFEEKWLLLLPKIMQEEERIEEEVGLKQTYHAQMAQEVSFELYKVDMRLNELRELVLQRCRKMSTLEKRELGRALTKLSADDLTKALEIVAQENLTFQATAGEVDLDIDAQSESTLWRLKCFIVEILQAQAEDQGKQSPGIGGGKNVENNGKTPGKASKPHKSNPKRKRVTVDALVKPAKKKTK